MAAVFVSLQFILLLLFVLFPAIMYRIIQSSSYTMPCIDQSQPHHGQITYKTAASANIIIINVLCKSIETIIFCPGVLPLCPPGRTALGLKDYYHHCVIV